MWCDSLNYLWIVTPFDLLSSVAFTLRQILAQDHQAVRRSAMDFRKVRGSASPSSGNEKTLPESLRKPKRGCRVLGKYRQSIAEGRETRVSLRPRSLKPLAASIKAARSHITYHPQSEHPPRIMAKFRRQTILHESFRIRTEDVSRGCEKRRNPLKGTSAWRWFVW